MEALTIQEGNESILKNQEDYIIKLDATHSHLKMRLTEIKFDVRQNITHVKQ